jgi:hypothetical protein
VQSIVYVDSPAKARVLFKYCIWFVYARVQLMKALETRKILLQKEQGMAFARAVAAGFDIDHMAHLISFAESFGALRLM